MIRFIDRLMCLLLGHVWERAGFFDGFRCPHCDKSSGRIELFNPRPRKRVW